MGSLNCPDQGRQFKLALENKKVIDVYVGDQTNKQLLFVKISANYL
jgi:hypothetical protein